MQAASDSTQIKNLVILGDKMADLIQYNGIENHSFSKQGWRTLLVNARIICIELMMIKYEVKLTYGYDNFEIGSDRLLNRMKNFRDLFIKPEMVIRLDELVGILPTMPNGRFCTEDIFLSKKFVRNEITAFITKGEFITFIDTRNIKLFDEIISEQMLPSFNNDRSQKIKNLARKFGQVKESSHFNTQFFWVKIQYV